MRLEDFIIETPEDLQLFADMLNDYGHPGEEVVRWLIINRQRSIARLEHISVYFDCSITEVIWAIIEHKEKTKCLSSSS